jgi:hypothetical protein
LTFVADIDTTIQFTTRARKRQTNFARTWASALQCESSI